MSFFRFLLVACLAQSAPVWGRRWGIQYSIGSSQFRGDLSEEREVKTQHLQLSLLYGQFGKRRWEYFLGIESLLLYPQHHGTYFPFAERAPLKMLAFLFIPYLCSPHDQGQICAGIGQGTVNVNSDKNRQDYGTWNYHLLGHYSVRPQWDLVLALKYVGKIEQQLNHVDSEFYLYSLLLGLKRYF